MEKANEIMTVEVTVKMTMKVNTHPRKWMKRCLTEWTDDVLEPEEELISMELETEVYGDE